METELADAISEALVGRTDLVSVQFHEASAPVVNDYRGAMIRSLGSAPAPAVEIWHVEAGGRWDLWIESYFYEEALDYEAARAATVARINAVASGGLGTYRVGLRQYTVIGNHHEIVANWSQGEAQLVSQKAPLIPGLPQLKRMPDEFYVRRGV